MKVGRLLFSERIEESLLGSVKEEVEPFGVFTEIWSETFVDSEDDMSVVNVKSGSGNAVCTCSCHFGTAGRAESAFTGIADDVVAMTIWTFIDFKTH